MHLLLEGNVNTVILPTEADVVGLVQYADDALQRKIRKLCISLEREPNPQVLDELKEALLVASPHHVRRPAILKRYGLEAGRGFSLHAELVLSSRESAVGGSRLKSWMLNKNSRAYEFIDLLGLVSRRKESTKMYSISDLPIQSGFAIRAAQEAGSRGHYHPKGVNLWCHEESGEILSGAKAVRTHAQTVMHGDNSNPGLTVDAWGYEEQVFEDSDLLEPARSVRFYTFYGEVGLIAEVTPGSNPAYCYSVPHTNQSVKPLRTAFPAFIGLGATDAEIDVVESVSRQIPAPFISLNFLRSKQGLVFSGATPHPGFVVEFTQSWDRHMGELWRLANGRLFEDLLEGKRFDAFFEVCGRVEQ